MNMKPNRMSEESSFNKKDHDRNCKQEESQHGTIPATANIPVLPQGDQHADPTNHRERKSRNRSTRPVYLRTSSTMKFSSNVLEEELACKKGSSILNEPTSFLELVESVGRRPQHNKVKSSCLKKEDILRTKAVRFATNAATNRVWCLVRTFKKEPKSKKCVLWWSDEDMAARSEEDSEIAANFEDYEAVLQDAFESAEKRQSKVEDVHLSFEDFEAYHDARGLEADLYPTIAGRVRLHREAVLAAQNTLLRGGSFRELEDADLTIIRLQSIKFSRPSQLVASKIGDFDQQIHRGA